MVAAKSQFCFLLWYLCLEQSRHLLTINYVSDQALTLKYSALQSMAFNLRSWDPQRVYRKKQGSMNL